jgi:hypothetical protein
MDYRSKIRKLYSLLFPTGRAWQYVRGSENRDGIQENYFDGNTVNYTDGVGQAYNYLIPQFFATEGKRIVDSKLKAYDQAYLDTLSIQNSVLPDNENFDEEDTTRWEQSLQIISNLTDLQERKQRIARQLFYPGGILERSHYKFIEDQLRASGFDVYIVENRFWNGSEFEVKDPDDLLSAEFELGVTNLGKYGLKETVPGTDYTSIIANSIDEDIDNEYFNAIFQGPTTLGERGLGTIILDGKSEQQLTRKIQLQGSFFLGGSTYPSFSTVPVERKEELRQLILKLKPTHTICFEYINYI